MKSEEYLEYLKKHYRGEDFYNQFLITDLPEKGKILDVGCGLGLFLRFLKNRAPSCELYGVEIDELLLREAQKNCPSAHLEKVQDESLPFPDNFFDFVFSLDVIEHVSNPVKHLLEIHRVMKPEANFILCTPDRMSYYRNIPWEYSENPLLINFLRLLGIRKLDPTHRREFTVLGLRRLLNRTGFMVILPNGLERIRKYPHHPVLARLRNWQLISKRLIPFHPYGSMIYLLKKKSF